jgi:hypothetical protein
MSDVVVQYNIVLAFTSNRPFACEVQQLFLPSQQQQRIPMHTTSTFGGKPMRPALGLLIFFSMVCLGAAQEQTYIGRHLTDFPGPRFYKDPTSGTLLTSKLTVGMWRQYQSKESYCGIETRSRMHICHLTERKSRKLFTSDQPPNSTTHLAKSRKGSLRFRLMAPNSD